MTAIYAVIRFQISNGAFDGLAELEQFAFFVSQSFVFAAVLDADTLVLLIHATVVRGNGHIFDRNVRQNATLLELFSQNVTIVRIVREAFSLLKYFIVDILDKRSDLMSTSMILSRLTYLTK